MRADGTPEGGTVQDGAPDRSTPAGGTVQDGAPDCGIPADGVTLRRMAHRVLMAAFSGPGPDLPAWLAAGLADGLGSVCLFGTNLTGDDDRLRRLIARLHAAAPDGCLVTLDEEGGDVTRLDALRGSPTAGHAVLGAVDDPGLTRAVAADLGARLRDLGVDLDLAPVADVNCEPDNPVIGVRSFGADPALVARHVAAFVAGLHGSGVAACVKHFPGHGATVEDSHLAVPRLDVDAATLRARELVPFAAAVRAGAAAVMTSHIVIAAVDRTGPATTSPAVLDLLRSELGFTGLVVSDALDMVGVSRPHGGIPAAAVAALAAGVDLLCLGPEHHDGELAALTAEVVEAILTAVRDGRLAPERLADAATRVDALIATLQRSSPASAAQPLPAVEPASAAQPLPAVEPVPAVERNMDEHTVPVQPARSARRTLAVDRAQRQPAAGTGDPSRTGDPAEEPNLVAARRAVHLQAGPGGVPALAGAVVVEFHVSPQIAAGPVPWGLAGPLADLLPGIERRVADREPVPDPVSGTAGVGEHLRAAQGRALVAVVRNAHRHPWVRGQLAALAAARPDLVVVETGWPLVTAAGTPTGLPGSVRMWTYGGSAVSLRCAAARLVAAGASR